MSFALSYLEVQEINGLRNEDSTVYKLDWFLISPEHLNSKIKQHIMRIRTGSLPEKKFFSPYETGLKFSLTVGRI